MENWSRADTRALIEAADDVPCMQVGVVRIIRRHYAEDGLVEKMARFDRFCEATNLMPFKWGEGDCSLLPCDWIASEGHGDPAPEWRGAYSTEAECRALLALRGGLLPVADACMASVGLQVIHEPQFGCYAVIGSRSNPERQWSALWNGRRWLVKWGDEKSAKWTPMMAVALKMWAV